MKQKWNVCTSAVYIVIIIYIYSIYYIYSGIHCITYTSYIEIHQSGSTISMTKYTSIGNDVRTTLDFIKNRDIQNIDSKTQSILCIRVKLINAFNELRQTQPLKLLIKIQLHCCRTRRQVTTLTIKMATLSRATILQTKTSERFFNTFEKTCFFI